MLGRNPPEPALRMILLEVLHDLSDRELWGEIQMHAGMRWFRGLNVDDPVPDHSTLSRLRNERWSGSGLSKRMKDGVIRQCPGGGLVSGRHLSVDGAPPASRRGPISAWPPCARPTLGMGAGRPPAC